MNLLLFLSNNLILKFASSPRDPHLHPPSLNIKTEGSLPWLRRACCNASSTELWARTQLVAWKRAAALTSNSWGISRRARYSLASLVFISGRRSSEITTSPKRFLFFPPSSDVSVQWSLANNRAVARLPPQRIFASRVDFTTEFLQAMPPRHPPRLLMQMRSASAFPPTAVRFQHSPTVCVCLCWRWHRGCALCAKKRTHRLCRTFSAAKLGLDSWLIWSWVIEWRSDGIQLLLIIIKQILVFVLVV